MAGHIIGTDRTRQADALPDAAWYATAIMGWRLVEYWRDPHEGDVILWHWVDQRGRHVAHEIGWDPKAHDADALQLVDAISMQMESRYLLWAVENTRTGVTCKIANEQPADPVLWCWGDAPTRPLAICRAVHVWWQAQQETP